MSICTGYMSNQKLRPEIWYMELRRRLIYHKLFHNRNESFRVIFSKTKFCHISSFLDKYFVLMPQELYVMELSKFLKRCFNDFFPTASIGNRWRQTRPKTFHKKRHLLPISRKKSGSISLIYRALKLYYVLKKIDHPFFGLRLPHPKFFTRSDIISLKQLVFRNKELLLNICN